MLRSTEVNPEPRTERAIQNLQEAGYRVELLFWNRTNRESKSIDKSVERIAYHKKTAYGAGWRNLKSQLGWQIWIAKKLFSEPKCLIYACDADTGLIATITCIFRKHVLVYDQFDQISSRFHSQWFNFIGSKVDKFISNRAKLTIVASQNRLFETKSKILVHSNNPAGRLQTKKSRHSGELFISYCGVLQPDRGLMELISAANSLEKVQITIAGFGLIEDQLKELKSNSLRFLGRINLTEVMDEYNRADVVYAMYDPSKINNKNTASSKLFESAIACTPCIVSEGTALADIVRLFDIGWVVKYGDVAELETLLGKLQSTEGPLISNFDEKRRNFLATVRSESEHSEVVSCLRELKVDIK